MTALPNARDDAALKMLWTRIKNLDHRLREWEVSHVEVILKAMVALRVRDRGLKHHMRKVIQRLQRMDPEGCEHIAELVESTLLEERRQTVEDYRIDTQDPSVLQDAEGCASHPQWNWPQQ